MVVYIGRYYQKLWEKEVSGRKLTKREIKNYATMENWIELAMDKENREEICADVNEGGIENEEIWS